MDYQQASEEVYAIMREIRSRYHEHLINERIECAWMMDGAKSKHMQHLPTPEDVERCRALVPADRLPAAYLDAMSAGLDMLALLEQFRQALAVLGYTERLDRACRMLTRASEQGAYLERLAERSEGC